MASKSVIPSLPLKNSGVVFLETMEKEKGMFSERKDALRKAIHHFTACVERIIFPFLWAIPLPLLLYAKTANDFLISKPHWGGARVFHLYAIFLQRC